MLRVTRCNRTAVRFNSLSSVSPAPPCAAARASAALAVASTASAASRHCCSGDRRELGADTAVTAAAAADSDVTPSPTSTQASSGSAAASPQTPTGLPAAAPARAVIATSASTPGCHGSVSAARSADIRSAAIVYCARSLVPMDRKSTCSRIRSASSAAAGTSIITPGVRPCARAWSAKTFASSAVAIIGAITHGALPVRSAAAAIACQLALEQPRVAGRRSGCRARRAPGWPRRDARRTSAACPNRHPGCGSPPCARETRRAPRRRSGPARRPSVRCRG